MIDDELDHLVEKLDLAQKVRLLAGATVWRTHAEPAIGLRAMISSDGPVGVRGEGWDERNTSPTLPSPTALAATWDEDLVERLGALLAAEARRKGVHILLAPTLNLHRSGLGGRHFECFSEDPLLTGRIGAAYIRGVQSGGVAATAKHFTANDSETERMTVDVRVDEQALHELYLAPFEEAVNAGAWVIMSGYNAVNGTTMSESPLLADPLKERWGFDGVVISDWGGVRSTLASARAAQDLAMPGPNAYWGDALLAAVRSGEVPESAIDDKVRRILRLAERVGALDPGGDDVMDATAEGHRPRALASRGGHGDPVPDRTAALLRQAVAAGCVLLRNEGALLPLDPASLRRVAVIGPNAAAVRIQGGGSAGVYPDSVVSPLEGIRDALCGTAEVAYAPGVSTTDLPTPLETVNARNPRTGEPGLLVRILDADEVEIHAEHRLTGRLLEPTVVDSAATVEVRALLNPAISGNWRLAVAGWGRVTLEADGRTLLDEEIPRDTDDPATVHLHPPYRTAHLALTAQTPVELVARRQLAPDTGRATVLAADPPRLDDDRELAAAADLARTCDIAVVVIGTTEEIESEGRDRTTLALPGRQNDLVTTVAAANPRTIVIVNSGGPIAMPWHTQIPALLLTWFPGQQAGHGLADILLGGTEPGGRLPTTWNDSPIATTTPTAGALTYTESLDIGYRAWLRHPDSPTYWFGHGLGYTTWSYESITADNPLTIRVRLRNTGPRPGRELVQLYLSHPGPTISRPHRWLAAYAPATADPGECTEVVLRLTARSYQHWSTVHHSWQTDPGPYVVLAGPSAGALPLTTTITPPVG
ncbi:glycoside hydrolase family 3 C-terminal domain-containing protein [Acrocarpospora macrocephala]|uniref:Glycosyl hydrolase n=1 Tax=Acrocarpospora macrocephala TaxID=150177 RepID=A0A5M3X331_9ACTN|nr:glycoside hydrolase family 3 C-terminal domain-containing protein [Acrocarpospora macrocephala]GES14499.1 glycosyl hydrolase [Acrocarpospora macrocephala]